MQIREPPWRRFFRNPTNKAMLTATLLLILAAASSPGKYSRYMDAALALLIVCWIARAFVGLLNRLGKVGRVGLALIFFSLLVAALTS